MFEVSALRGIFHSRLNDTELQHLPNLGFNDVIQVFALKMQLALY